MLGCPADLVMVGQGLLCCGKPLVLGHGRTRPVVLWEAVSAGVSC